jgi:dipeptidase E
LDSLLVVQNLVAMGGGFTMDPTSTLLDDYVLALTGRDVPRICFLPTASGDSEPYIARFYDRFRPEAECTHISLFGRPPADLEKMLLGQDIIYVGGGNSANMLAIWRIHDVGPMLEKAWNAGVVLAGVSAGAICWFETGVTDSFGPLAALRGGGLGLLPGSMCPHYDSDPERRPTYHRLVGEGMAGGFALDDGVAMHFAGTTHEATVSARQGPRAYRVARGEGGRVSETPLVTRCLA